MSDPFGAPTEEMIDLPIADETDDPFRPIGTYNEEGKLVVGSTNKAQAIGKCVALEQKQGPSGPMIVFGFVATEGTFAGREFPLYCSFSPKARFKVVETYQGLGLPEKGPWPKSQPIGVYVTLNLQDEEYEGKFSAKLKGISKHPKGVGYRGTTELS
jgi:hypothetical protein